MTENRLDFSSFSINLPQQWLDVTASIDDVDAPITLADPVQGVGALQLSCASYIVGPRPKISLIELSNMLDDFVSQHDFQLQLDRRIYPGDLLLLGRSFKSDGDFIRVWYVSDSMNVVFATYTCEWAKRDVELAQREAAIMSLTFKGPPCT